MSLFAIGDLHLALGAPEKNMEVFSGRWTGYVDKVGTGTMDIVTLCKEKGLKAPEYHQEEDFRVVIWRKGFAGDPNRSKSDPNTIQIGPDTVPDLVEQVYRLIVADRKISREKLAKLLNTSERQVREAIEELRDKRIRRKGKTRGEWEIIG